MQYYGIVIHHSACSSINGKGYDYFIAKNGDIIPSSEQTDPLYIHLCLEGDFSGPHAVRTPAEKEQLFLMNKLILRLSKTYGFQPDDIFPHSITCPGGEFPWSQLVISPEDRYH
ncbi:N-acetylmuramoyl-L-alanine amidase [Paenibacillus elgii]